MSEVPLYLHGGVDLLKLLVRLPDRVLQRLAAR